MIGHGHIESSDMSLDMIYVKIIMQEYVNLELGARGNRIPPSEDPSVRSHISAAYTHTYIFFHKLPSSENKNPQVYGSRPLTSFPKKIPNTLSGARRCFSQKSYIPVGMIYVFEYPTGDML